MKLKDILFLGTGWLVTAIMFGMILRHEYQYDQRIQSEGRLATVQFLRVVPQGTVVINFAHRRLRICEFSVTDNANKDVHITEGECPDDDDKTPFQQYYLPENRGHKLLRLNSLWNRPVVLVLGIIFIFISGLFLFCLISYKRTNSVLYSALAKKSDTE